MGLIKEFKQLNGMRASYHRIETMIKTGDDVKIKVISYVDKNTRIHEEKILAWKKRFDEILEKLDNDGLAELIEEVGPDYHEIKEFGPDYFVSTKEMSFSYSGDLNNEMSMSKLYEVLAITEPFDGAVPDD